MKFEMGDQFNHNGEIFYIIAIDYASDVVTAKNMSTNRLIYLPFYTVEQYFNYGTRSYETQKCECGSDSTYKDPEYLHSTWCPKFKKPY